MADFPVLLAVMTAAALACRFGGYAAMRFVSASPRLEAALKATPVAVMAAIAALALARGGLTDALALGAGVVLTLATGRDMTAAFTAVGLAALLRAAGM